MFSWSCPSWISAWLTTVDRGGHVEARLGDPSGGNHDRRKIRDRCAPGGRGSGRRHGRARSKPLQPQHHRRQQHARASLHRASSPVHGEARTRCGLSRDVMSSPTPSASTTGPGSSPLLRRRYLERGQGNAQRSIGCARRPRERGAAVAVVGCGGFADRKHHGAHDRAHGGACRLPHHHPPHAGARCGRRSPARGERRGSCANGCDLRQQPQHRARRDPARIG